MVQRQKLRRTLSYTCVKYRKCSIFSDLKNASNFCTLKKLTEKTTPEAAFQKRAGETNVGMHKLRKH